MCPRCQERYDSTFLAEFYARHPAEEVRGVGGVSSSVDGPINCLLAMRVKKGRARAGVVCTPV